MDVGDEVAAILDALRGLLGEGTPVTAPLPSTIPTDIETRLDALPGGLGALIERLVASRKSQAEISAELALLDPSLVPVVDESGSAVAAGRAAIERVRTEYAQRRQALSPLEGTPMGQLAVLQSKADAVGQGAEAIRNQLPPAELRRVLVDGLAQRYYQQAKAAQQGMGAGGAGAGGPGGPTSLRALSGLAGAPAGVFSGLSAGSGGGGDNAGRSAGLLSARADRRDTDAGPLSSGVGSEARLQNYTILAKRAISAAFPEISDIGGYRPDALKWHPSGQAIDVMIPHYRSAEGRLLGDRILAYTMQHARQFSIDHVIWRQTLYTPDSQPRLMGNRGDDNQNHFNHLHIATTGGGYPTGRESYEL